MTDKAKEAQEFIKELEDKATDYQILEYSLMQMSRETLLDLYRGQGWFKQLVVSIGKEKFKKDE